MCSCGDTLSQEAQEALAELLTDICKALDPEHPEQVRIGPVDFGTGCLTATEPISAVRRTSRTSASRDDISRGHRASPKPPVGPLIALGESKEKP